MLVDEVVQIREQAKRLLSTKALRRLSTEMEILEDIGERAAWTVPPPSNLALTSRKAPVVGRTVEDAARSVRQALRPVKQKMAEDGLRKERQRTSR